MKLGDYEIAWVDAEVGKMENDTLSLLPLSTAPPPHKSVLVGDLKMADFKQFLADNGVQVHFHAFRLSFYCTMSATKQLLVFRLYNSSVLWYYSNIKWYCLEFSGSFCLCLFPLLKVV